MSANANDLFQYVGDPGTATTLSAPGYTSGGTSINVGSTTNFPTTTGVIFAIDETETVDGEEARVAGTYNVYRGTVATGTSINNLAWVTGDGDRNYAAGSGTRVYITTSAGWANNLVDGLLVSLDQLSGEVNTAGLAQIAADLPANSLSPAVILNTYGTLGNTEYYTASDTWTKPAGLKYVVVEVQGAGGGGGGSGNTAERLGAGGAGGGYAKKKILAAALSSTETVTIGAAGAAGTTTGDGGSGGASSFGAHATGNGGAGGVAGSTSTAIDGPSGGTGTGGDINISGQDGFAGGTIAASGVGSGYRSGFGGSSIYGHGAPRGSGSNDAGKAGAGYGAGGSGGSRNTVSSAGGAGTAGLVIVNEYF